MSLLSSLRLGRRSPNPAQATAVGHPRVPPSYTPHDPGIAVAPVDDILSEPAYVALLERIHLAYGCSRETFDRHVYQVVRRYAEYVHLLPATTDNYFCEPGGLLRMGLEVGFMSLQASDSVIFAGRETVSHRMHLEPRWRYATFLAGLLCELHTVYSKLNVTSAVEGEDWPAYMRPLTLWCADRGFERYYLRWSPRPLEARGQSLFAVPYILPPHIMQFLADSNTVIVPHMLGSISRNPSHKEKNPIDGVVKIATANVIERYLVGSAERYGKAIVGTHVERYLVDAMQRLVIAGTWVINAPKARLWFGLDGLFLVWPNAATDVVRLLEKDNLPGIPKAPDSIAEVLLDVSAFDRNADGGHLFWIRPPEATEPIATVRITRHLMLTSSLPDDPQPLPVKLEVPAPRPVASPAAAKPTSSASASPAPAPSSLSPVATVPASSAPPTSASLPSPPFEIVDDEDDYEAQDGSLIETSAPGVAEPVDGKALGVVSGDPKPRVIEFLPNTKVSPEVRKAVSGYLSALVAAPDLCRQCVTADGVLMPVREFHHRGQDKSAAVRMLHDANVLVLQAKGAKAMQRRIAGEDLLCIVLSPAAVRIDSAQGVLDVSV